MLIDEKSIEVLRTMKHGVWYCASDYEGCEVIPEDDVLRRALSALVKKGLVDSEPVFEGFVIEKYKISEKGIEASA